MSREEVKRAPLEQIRALFAELDRAGVNYCHWKSNCRLSQTLRGEADIDLLIDRQCVGAFAEVLARLGFRPANAPGGDVPSVHHYYALDEATGRIAHLHAYTRLITGGALFKNYALPLERLYLDHTEIIEGVRIPARGAELLLFVVRKSLERDSLFERLMLRREDDLVREEIAWLDDEAAERQALELLRDWFPTIRSDTFLRCLAALREPGSSGVGDSSSRELARALRGFRRVGVVRATRWRLARLSFMVAGKLQPRRRGHVPWSGGLLVAFVGLDGSGKSTMVRATAGWLGEAFRLRTVHLGRPPSSWLTLLPNLFLPLMRRVFPEQRMTRIAAAEARGGEPPPAPGWMALIRAVLYAHDQERAVRKAFREAKRGTVVLADRYPSWVRGGIDGGRMNPDLYRGKSRGKEWLARKENQIYRRLPPPDLVIHLTAPFETSLERTNQRTETSDREDQDSLHVRIRQTNRWAIPGVPTHEVDSSQEPLRTLKAVQRVIWPMI